MKNNNPQCVDLGLELGQIGSAIQAARILTEQLAFDGILSLEDKKIVPSTISATLSLVTCRIQILIQAVEGSIDPKMLWCSRNCAAPDSNGDSTLLTEWSLAKRLAHAETELGRARTQSQRDQQARVQDEDDRS